MAGKWIAGIKMKRGSLTAAAKRAGMATMAFARAKRHAKGTLGRRARLALTLQRLPRPSHAARVSGARKAARPRARRRA